MSDQNLVSATLTDTDRDAALLAISTIATKLPFLLGLSVEDRINLQKMGNVRRSFVEQTVPIASQNAQVLPASFNLAELTADMDLYRQLAPIMDALKPVFEKLDDTLMALGSDLYAASLEAYGYIKAAGRSQGLDALREQLKASRQRAAKQKDTPPTP
ncbi:MAG TPA: hypothetical protein VK474_12680 [Chthoniobacterales bacterium]|nr:hypothetical protein [Chthoniobacterales bacterium]